jgi:hypothetical protein
MIHTALSVIYKTHAIVMDARAAHVPLKGYFDVYGGGWVSFNLTPMPLLQNCHRDGPVGEQHAHSRKAHPPAILHPPSSSRSTSSILSPPCTVVYHPHLIIFPSQRILPHLQLFIRHPAHPSSSSSTTFDHMHTQLILHPQLLPMLSRSSTITHFPSSTHPTSSDPPTCWCADDRSPLIDDEIDPEMPGLIDDDDGNLRVQPML